VSSILRKAKIFLSPERCFFGIKRDEVLGKPSFAAPNNAAVISKTARGPPMIISVPPGQPPARLQVTASLNAAMEGIVFQHTSGTAAMQHGLACSVQIHCVETLD
jgi:hypothetical protein